MVMPLGMRWKVFDVVFANERGTCWCCSYVLGLGVEFWRRFTARVRWWRSSPAGSVVRTIVMTTRKRRKKKAILTWA